MAASWFQILSRSFASTYLKVPKYSYQILHPGLDINCNVRNITINQSKVWGCLADHEEVDDSPDETSGGFLLFTFQTKFPQNIQRMTWYWNWRLYYGFVIWFEELVHWTEISGRITTPLNLLVRFSPFPCQLSPPSDLRFNVSEQFQTSDQPKLSSWLVRTIIVLKNLPLGPVTPQSNIGYWNWLWLDLFNLWRVLFIAKDDSKSWIFVGFRVKSEDFKLSFTG